MKRAIIISGVAGAMWVLSPTAYSTDFSVIYDGKLGIDLSTDVCVYSEQHILFENNSSKTVSWEVITEGVNGTNDIYVTVASNKSQKVYTDDHKVKAVNVFREGEITRFFSQETISKMDFTTLKCYYNKNKEKSPAMKIKVKKDGSSRWNFRHK